MWCDVLVGSINLWLLQIDNVDCFSFIKTMCIIHVHKLLLFIVVIYRCYWVFFYCYIVAVANIVRWSDHKGILNLKWLNRFDFFLCVFFLYFYINSISTTCSIIIDDCLANMWLLWRKEIAWMKSNTLENSWRVDFGDKNPDAIV